MDEAYCIKMHLNEIWVNFNLIYSVVLQYIVSPWFVSPWYIIVKVLLHCLRRRRHLTNMLKTAGTVATLAYCGLSFNLCLHVNEGTTPWSVAWPVAWPVAFQPLVGSGYR